MNASALIPCLLAILATAACDVMDESVSPESYVFDFKTDAQAWISGFADHPNEPGIDIFYELSFSHAKLPAPLDTTEGALRESVERRVRAFS
jgi:hypothetical protein